MDRWISTAWKAFWVGLGASAVLVAQAVLAPAPPAAAAPVPAVQAPHSAPAAAPAAQIGVNHHGAYASYLSGSPRCSADDRC